MTAFQAILRQRCPRCREGRIFRAPFWRSPLGTNPRCAVCGLKFEREQGYFVGAMYFGYLLSMLPALCLMFLFWRVAGLPYDVSWLAAAGAYLPFAPLVARMSRVIWIHVDRSIDPGA